MNPDLERMYAEDDENRFLEVTYQNGDKEVLYFRDFSSGAMIENIVRRSKKLSIKPLAAMRPTQTTSMPPTRSRGHCTRRSKMKKRSPIRSRLSGLVVTTRRYCSTPG